MLIWAEEKALVYSNWELCRFNNGGVEIRRYSSDIIAWGKRSFTAYNYESSTGETKNFGAPCELVACSLIQGKHDGIPMTTYSALSRRLSARSRDKILHLNFACLCFLVFRCMVYCCPVYHNLIYGFELSIESLASSRKNVKIRISSCPYIPNLLFGTSMMLSVDA